MDTTPKRQTHNFESSAHMRIHKPLISKKETPKKLMLQNVDCLKIIIPLFLCRLGEGGCVNDLQHSFHRNNLY